ncbi:MAG TPA: hypothetical protein VG295_07085 [Solirubrobacteraceae bacterium]|jgi:hypothetical protein|nr:hypothetical protein [Solirubrobacteraceae bacterium]
MGFRAALAALVLTAVVAGCGGAGSSSAERSKLANEISSQLRTGSAPPDLSSCVRQQSLGLPTPQLRAVAEAGSHPPPATKQLAFGLIATCIKQGHGIALIHGLITKGILSGLDPSQPAVFRNCIVAKANATTPAQLAQLISAYATQNLAVAQSRARQTGVALAAQCLAVPGVLRALRPVFLAPVRRDLRTTSAAFRSCVLAKAERIGAAQLERFVLNPATATARGEAFGARMARECIASGAKP